MISHMNLKKHILLLSMLSLFAGCNTTHKVIQVTETIEIASFKKIIG
jgi:uncharacterized lipoprotein YajG